MQDPSPPAVPPPSPAAGAHPWRDDEPLHPHAFDRGRHGYVVDGRLEACDYTQMVRHLAKQPWTPGVYVPGAEALARPEEVPGLLDAYRREAVRRATRDVLWLGLFAAASIGLLVWSVIRWKMGLRSLPGLMAVFGITYLVLGVHGVRAARRVQADVFVQSRQAQRHWEWAKRHPAYFMWALAVPLGVTFLMTSHDSAIPRAALVKPAVWNGEWWRMLTGPMMHGGGYHLWMNLSALYALGRLVEAHATRFHLAAVFLASVVGGSALSVLLSPQTSVGASGGVMGLIGFLWVMARLRPAQLPDDFGRRMNYAIGATALLGVLGIEFIDNWAHLGGLLAGGGVGWLMLREGAWERREGWPVAVAGSLAMVVLWLAMLGAAGLALGAFGG
jgi:membrane associated rhomboid family serine protease